MRELSCTPHQMSKLWMGKALAQPLPATLKTLPAQALADLHCLLWQGSFWSCLLQEAQQRQQQQQRPPCPWMPQPGPQLTACTSWNATSSWAQMGCPLPRGAGCACAT